MVLRCINLAPANWLVAFFAEATLGELSRDRFGRFALKKPPLQKCHCEASDCTTYCPCCSALTCVAENCTTGTTGCGTGDRTRRRTRDWIFRRSLFVLSSFRARFSDTFVNISLGRRRPNGGEMRVRGEHRLLRCTTGDYD